MSQNRYEVADEVYRAFRAEEIDRETAMDWMQDAIHVTEVGAVDLLDSNLPPSLRYRAEAITYGSEAAR